MRSVQECSARTTVKTETFCTPFLAQQSIHPSKDQVADVAVVLDLIVGREA